MGEILVEVLHRLIETRVDDTDKATGIMLRPKARGMAECRKSMRKALETNHDMLTHKEQASWERRHTNSVLQNSKWEIVKGEKMVSSAK